MRALVPVVVVIFLLVSYFGARELLRLAARRQERQRVLNMRWEPHSELDAESTEPRRRVYVQKGYELEPVGSVRISDPDYDMQFHELMAQALERAAMLNSESI